MAQCREDGGEDHQVRAQAAGAGKARQPMGSDREQGRAGAAAGKKKGKKPLRRAAVRQVQAGPQPEGRAALAGEKKVQAALAREGGERGQQDGSEVPGQHRAARRQAPRGRVRVGQAARVAEQPEERDGPVPAAPVLA